MLTSQGNKFIAAKFLETRFGRSNIQTCKLFKFQYFILKLVSMV